MKRDWDKIRTILEKIETDELKAYYCESFKDLPEYKAAETEKEAEKSNGSGSGKLMSV